MSELTMQKSNPTKEHKDKPSKKNAMLIANLNICKDVVKKGRL